MSYLFKLLFQSIAFGLWICIVFNTFWLSVVTWIVFIVTSMIFLFWFIVTSIGWTFTFLPLFKFIFIPWHRRRCQLSTGPTCRWTVAFFHPYCSDGTAEERILWTTVRALLKKYPNRIDVVIYHFEKNLTVDAIFHRVQQRCDISLKPYRNSIRFLALSSQWLWEKRLDRISPALISILISFEALIRFIPDVYFDSIGDVFTYPCFSFFASVPIISSIDHPLLLKSNENKGLPQPTSWINQFEWIFDRLFMMIYTWCAQCSTLAICHSPWTKKQTEIFFDPSRTCCISPPCHIETLAQLPMINRNEQKLQTIVSFGPFRSEENRELQIQVFDQLLKS